jgi:hypothetical protein
MSTSDSQQSFDLTVMGGGAANITVRPRKHH